MAAPTPVTRQTPVGRKLKDGFPVKVTFGADPDLSIWEKTLKPGKLTNGDPIDQTTQWNVTYTTKAPQGLIDIENITGSCAYDPAVKTQLIALIKVETSITLRFCDGSTWTYWGYLMSFDPSEMERGTQPDAQFEIVITNYDNSGNVEAGPAVASVAGT